MATPKPSRKTRAKKGAKAPTAPPTRARAAAPAHAKAPAPPALGSPPAPASPPTPPARPTPPGPSAPPSRREEVRDALCEAVLRLMTRKSAAGISVRDIAEEAAVNHGLVHRYFGSKQGLIREAVRRQNARVHDDLRERWLASRTFEILRERPEIVTLLTRCCLDGPLDLLELGAPPTRRLEADVRPIKAELDRLGIDIDPYVVNALCASALLGWFAFRPYFATGYRLPRDPDAEVAKLAAILDAMRTSPLDDPADGD